VLGIHGYLLFLLTGVMLNLAPGQDTLFIIGRSLTGGRRFGVAAAFGIAAGTVCHTLAAAVGLSAILAASAAAFTAVKLAGGAYLVFLGVKLLLARSEGGNAQTLGGPVPAGARAVFAQGIATNVLNPKVALFFLAFLPQFIAPTSGAKTLAFLALGGTFIATGLIWSLVLAVGAARLQAFFSRNPSVRKLVDRAVGSLFVGLGVRLAWER